MEKFLRIGVITSAHGLKGEVKVYPTTDSLQRFKQVRRVVLKTPKGDVETEIVSVKSFKGQAIVRFAAYDDVEQVKNLHNTDVMIYREDGQKLAPGEYYIADLIGCRVVSDEGKMLGILKDVLQTGANDVYIIDTADADSEMKLPEELLLPVIPDCIRNVDIEAGEVTVHLMDGLI